MKKKSNHNKSAASNEADSPLSNPAIIGLMADTEKNWARESAKRNAWLKDNEPPSIYGPSFCSREYENLHHDELELHRHTYNALKNGLPFKPRNITTWRHYAVEAAFRSTYDGLRHLQYLVSQKDQGALMSIADIATDATGMLSKISSRDVERVRPIAQHRFFWPFLKASKEHFGDDHKRIVKEIQLGEAAPFSRDAIARVRENNITVRMAMTCLCRLEDYRKPPTYFGLNVKTEWQRLAMKLQPFSAGTWHEWFEVAWKAVLADYDGHPERDMELMKIGKYRAERVKIEGPQEVVKLNKTRESNIKDGIRESFRLAIKRLAKVPNNSSKK